MQVKTIVCCAALLAGTPAILSATAVDTTGTTFQVSAPTGIPGRILEPGQYTISLVDHLSDRAIVRVAGKGQQDSTVFLAIPNKSLELGSHPGMVRWGDKVNGDGYLRGWKFAGTPTTLEFAYPKDDAVALAKANSARVPAIDPASEGMVANAGLTNEQMHIVTLWLLQPTRVTATAPGGIQAQRWQPQLASNAHKPAIAKLPHTASTLPLWWALGTLSLVGAAGFRLRRATAGREA